MIIYRPHKFTLDEAMKEAVEFNTEEEMKAFISKTYANIDVNDIVIEGPIVDDVRNNWHDTRYVCLKKYKNLDGDTVDLVKKYGTAQCIGMCATDYLKIERDKSMDRADYWKNICEMQEKQTKKGISKYGQVLEDNDTLTIIDGITYLQEELIDGLMYCEHIKSMLLKKTKDIKICSKCGTKYDAEYRYCLNCGYDEGANEQVDWSFHKDFENSKIEIIGVLKKTEK